MLPGKRYFYRCCKARRSASHVNKEFWQQFQNYAPPSLRVIRTKIARTIYNWRASEASETLSGLFNRDRGYIYYWRASEASETLSCLFNRESRIYVIVIPWLRGIIVDNCPDSRGRSPSERAVSVR